MSESNVPPSKNDGVEVYVRGPGWPCAVNDAPVNPWRKASWNLTDQVKVLKSDPAEAMRLARAAGHRDALSARVENAK
jgi:hypothetical protein